MNKNYMIKTYKVRFKRIDSKRIFFIKQKFDFNL